MVSTSRDEAAARDRARGALLGLACGDALGRPVEFMSAAEIDAEYGTVDQMLADGTWGQPAGTITDDTEMALCIARSYADTEQFDPEDIATRFVDWYERGPFDIGGLTRDAIQQLQQGADWHEAGKTAWMGRVEGRNAGNGSVMRCAPHAIAFDDDVEGRLTASRQCSRITHYDSRCRGACVVLNSVLGRLINGSTASLANAIEEKPLGTVLDNALDPIADAITAAGESDDEEWPTTYSVDLQTSGYVVDTLQTALHDALLADSAEQAIIRSVNRGGDADTIGAVCGAVAGARFGASTLPDTWVDAIDEADELRSLADQLLTIKPERPPALDA